MGKVVAAFGQSHILLDDTGVENQVGNIIGQYKNIGKIIRSLNPDLIVVISDDHMLNITAAQQIPLAVCVADRFTPMGDMDVPTDIEIKGNRGFAQGFLDFAFENDFDLAKLEVEGYKPDHGVAMPTIFATPDLNIPIVPILCNINMTPSPSPARCWRLGQVLANYIESRPEEERVVVIGTGGLSHWLQIENDGNLNEEWDRDTLERFSNGDFEYFSSLTTSDILELGGNGGTEIRNWLVMAATSKGLKGQVLFYEPMYSWKTGIGAVAFL